MVRVRLKAGCAFNKMNTPYGLVTHEWSVVRDDAYIYKEMEVDGLPQPKTVVEPTPVPQTVVDPKPKPVEDPKPAPKLKVSVKKAKASGKKKRSRKTGK